MVEPETHPAPLDRLHALKLDETEEPATVDYVALGIGPEHIPALIGIVTDRRFDAALLPAGWAPLHAWRALGALRAADAAEPLTTLLDRATDDDWILEEVPRSLGLIGAPAIPIVAHYLADRERHHWGRVAAS